MDNPDFFSISSGSLDSEFEWADVVIYASSTVGLEAVFMDIPAVLLDADDLLETDPMFGWNDFKWSATGPAELIAALQDIEGLDDESFRVLRMKGRDYAESYLSPVTESALDAFEGVSTDLSSDGPDKQATHAVSS